MNLVQKIQFFLQNLGTKKLIALVTIAFLVVVLPLVVLLGGQQQETRQHASGTNTTLFFGINGPSPSNLKPGDQINLYLNLGSDSSMLYNGFDVTVNYTGFTLNTVTPEPSLTEPMRKFKIVLNRKKESTSVNTLRYAGVVEKPDRLLSVSGPGSYPLVQLSLTALQPRTGRIEITQSSVTSPTLQNSFVATTNTPVSYAITQNPTATPTRTPTPTRTATPTPLPSPTPTIHTSSPTPQATCRPAQDYFTACNFSGLNWCTIGTTCNTGPVAGPAVNISCPSGQKLKNTGIYCTYSNGQKSFNGASSCVAC